MIGMFTLQRYRQSFVPTAGADPLHHRESAAGDDEGLIKEAGAPIKILAVLAEADTAAACLDAAEAAGRAVGGASIEALHIVVDPRSLATASEEISYQRLREAYEGTAEERAAAVRAAFNRWIHFHPTADIPFSWKELVGGEQASLIREAQHFDLLVLARAKNIDGADALHAAVFAIRHPFVLVPSHWRLRASDTFGQNIVIAWNGTKGCMRAALGALPWLQASGSVTVLLIDEPQIRLEWLETLLKGACVTFRIERVKRNWDETLGDQIVDEAHKRMADLLVIGAYRHNQFIEWLLGSTTRHVLARLDLPLLAAH